MSMPIYDLLYKTHGIRKIQQLLMPRVFQDTDFTFPRGVTCHYVTHDGNNDHPDPDTPMFKNLGKRILTEHITDLTSTKGNPRKRSILPMTLIKPWHITQKTFKFLKDAHIENKNALQLSLINYGYLNELYKYTDIPLTTYYKWWNIERTAWDTVKKACSESPNQNYIFFKIPDILPSVSLLRMFSDKANTALVKVFDNPAKLSVLEFWKWIDPTTQADSVMGTITALEASKINIVFQYHGTWALLNLSYFMAWTKGVVDVAEDKKSTIDIPPASMQKYFLKMLMSIQTYGSDVLDNADTTPLDDITDGDVADTTENDDGEADDGTDLQISTINNTTNKPEYKVDHTLLKDIEVAYSDTGIMANVIQNLDADLDALEKISKLEMMSKGVKLDSSDIAVKEVDLDVITVALPSLLEVEDMIYTDVSDTEYLSEKIDKYAEYGVISGSEYKNMLKIANEFNHKPSPYNAKVNMQAFKVITPDMLKIDVDKAKLKDSDTVFDKTMLNDRISVFDKTYIKDIMHKDIVSMATSIQRAGVMVQAYDVEEVSSVLGAYEIHTLKVKPIDGAASTLRFKIPKVNTDGEMTISGNKYKTRKQRADFNLFSCRSLNYIVENNGPRNVVIHYKKTCLTAGKRL